MSEYEVWSEGYAATGQRAPAFFHGKAEAPSFSEACRLTAERAGWGDLFNPERLTYWSCRLFDNEADARKSFG